MRRFTLLVVLAIASTGGICSENFSDKPPNLSDRPVPKVEDSTVQMPISVSLSAMQQQVEQAVPRSLGAAPYNEQVNGGADNCGGNGISFGYGVDRTLLALSVSGNTVRLGFGVDYWAKARARRPLIFGACSPPIYASCGADNEPRRRAQIEVALPVSVVADWRLSAGRGQVSAGPDNRCQVTIFNIDVTDRIMNVFQNQLQAQADALDGRLQQVPLRNRVEGLWRTLSSPISVAPDTWLAVNPRALSVSQLQGAGDLVRVTVGMTARPTITFGSAPPLSDRPLPNVTPPTGGAGYYLAVPVYAQTSALTKQLRIALKLADGGIRYPPTGRFYVRPQDVELWAYGTQVVVRIRFGGSARGVLYLTGTPQWNGVTNELSVPDLDYTLETKNLLLKLVNWAEGDKFRDDMRNRLHINLAAQIDEARRLLNRALNRQVGPLRLTGSVAALRVTGLYVHPGDSTVQVIVLANGDLRGDVQ